MAKRYYWLKLNENFFEREEIKVIEMQPNGEKYIIFYFKLLLKSLYTNGRLMFRNIMPYTPEILSKVTNTDVDTVKVAIDMFVKFGLMDKLDDGAFFMSEIENMTGSETEWAQKKRMQRKKDDNLSLDLPKGEDNVPIESQHEEDNLGQCPIRDKSIENRDKSIENREEDKENKENLLPRNYSNFSSIAIYLEKNGFGIQSPNIIEKLSADIDIYGSKWVFEAITIADEKGVHTYTYIKSILQNWKNKGKWGDTSGTNTSNKSDLGEQLREEGIGFTSEDL